MMPVAFLIAVQLVYAVLIVGISFQPKILSQAKHEVKNVLGVSRLADETTPTSESAPAPAEPAPPAESAPVSNPPSSQPESPQNPPQSAPVQPESSSIAPAPAASTETAPVPAETSTQPSSQTPGEILNTPGTSGPGTGSETVSPSPGINETPAEALTDTPGATPVVTVENTITPSPTPAALESSVSQTEAVLNPENIINNPEHVDKESITEVTKEEDAIDQAQSPEERGSLLIIYAKDKMNDIDKNITKDDFTTTTFASTRLSDEIDRISQEIQQAPAAQSQILTKQVTDFCQSADVKLKNQLLSVPEEAEQDLEISRAKCFDYQ